MSGCEICGSDLSLAKEKRCISCPSCEKTACSACTRRYLSASADLPHCLFCWKSWQHPFMIETFPTSFLNGPMKISRQNTLLNEQKARLPDSHGDVQAEVRKRKRVEDIRLARDKITTMKQHVQSEERSLHLLTHCTDDSIVPNQVLNKRSYKCPVETCRGFLSDWACSVCATQVCSKCLGVVNEGHKCDAGSVETVRLLSQDTKPCPGCGEGIMKIVGGCDQMWCTGCQTTFSWKTGKKTHGLVHNPHYFDYLRKHGHIQRNPLDVECGGMPNIYHLIADCKCPWNLDIHSSMDLLTRYMRNFNHNRDVESTFYPTTMDLSEHNTKLRVQFLLGEIEEAGWKESLYKNEKKHILKKELGEILALVDDTSAEIVRQLHACVKVLQRTIAPDGTTVAVSRRVGRKTPAWVCNDATRVQSAAVFAECFNELEALRSYANDCLERVGVSFCCKFPQYGERFAFMRYTEKQKKTFAGM